MVAIEETTGASAAPELKWLQNQARLNQALRAETQCRIKWLELEQHRLALQSALLTSGNFSLVQDDRQLQPLDTLVAMAGDSKDAFRIAADGRPARTTSYLESISATASGMLHNVPSGWVWNRLRWHLFGSAFTNVGSDGKLRRRGMLAGQSLLTTDSIRYPVRRAMLNYSGELQTGRFRSRIPRYSDEYSFGMRRPEFRRSLGIAPWYLPGSPTNFR